MKKRLSELKPHLGKARLRFNCPACSPTHWVIIAIHPDGKMDDAPVWECKGDTVENLTLNPSLDGTQSGHCKFHGWIKNGEVTW